MSADAYKKRRWSGGVRLDQSQSPTNMQHLTTLAGSTFKQPELSAIFTKTRGQPFSARLQPEPENPYDVGAIAVYEQATRTLLGYIPKKDQGLFPCTDGNKDISCHIEFWKAKELYLVKLDHLAKSS